MLQCQRSNNVKAFPKLFDVTTSNFADALVRSKRVFAMVTTD